MNIGDLMAKMPVVLWKVSDSVSMSIDDLWKIHEMLGLIIPC